ncbi:hypothetical protein B0H14DRAFT_3728942 [Mycena olivaceomarginata]|nr:hypothetical protein B0H14DRAFT_3728942 [Mycena olivaceomarginata]
MTVAPTFAATVSHDVGQSQACPLNVGRDVEGHILLKPPYYHQNIECHEKHTIVWRVDVSGDDEDNTSDAVGDVASLIVRRKAKKRLAKFTLSSPSGTSARAPKNACSAAPVAAGSTAPTSAPASRANGPRLPRMHTFFSACSTAPVAAGSTALAPHSNRKRCGAPADTHSPHRLDCERRRVCTNVLKTRDAPGARGEVREAGEGRGRERSGPASTGAVAVGHDSSGVLEREGMHTRVRRGRCARSSAAPVAAWSTVPAHTPAPLQRKSPGAPVRTHGLCRLDRERRRVRNGRKDTREEWCGVSGHSGRGVGDSIPSGSIGEVDWTIGGPDNPPRALLLNFVAILEQVKEALHLCSANAHRYTVFWMFLAFGSHSDSSMLNQATGNMGLLYRFG